MRNKGTFNRYMKDILTSDYNLQVTVLWKITKAVKISEKPGKIHEAGMLMCVFVCEVKDNYGYLWLRDN